MAEEKKGIMTTDAGRSRRRQSEFAHGGPARAGGLRRFSAGSKSWRTSTGRESRSALCTRRVQGAYGIRLYERGDQQVPTAKCSMLSARRRLLP